MSANVTVDPSTPWKQYYCGANNQCTTPNTECHYGKYCIPKLAPGETCLDAKDKTDPFVARIDNVYTLFCDMPTSLQPQNTTCPLGCEKWEDCHANVCFVKPCTKDQTACKNGDLNMCNGVKRDEIFCYEANPHGNTHPAAVEDSGLSSAQVGGIAGGVSVAVVIAAAVGAFFLIRRRRANKAKAHASNDSLPTYSAPNGNFGGNEKQMQQVVSA
ncbi:hypothetical protein BGZ76_000183 [Entomortierella beljakovae]|nr:hypothetical protein BGZ76_000183 [Entomortierella beljakovae]